MPGARTSAQKEAQNAQRLIADLELCDYNIEDLKNGFVRVTHPRRPGVARVPKLLSDRNVQPQIDRLRQRVDYDPDEVAVRRAEDRQARLERGKHVPAAPLFVPPNVEPAETAPAKTTRAPAKAPQVAATGASESLFDQLYAQAQQIAGGKIKFVRVEMDAFMSAELLKMNTFWTPKKGVRESYVRSNRPVKQDTVISYAYDMAEGLWYESDQAIAFFDDGALGNGQHRMLAVQHAAMQHPDRDIKVPFLLAFDVDPSAWPGYDLQVRRTFVDHATADGDKNARLLGAAISLVMRHDQDKNWRLKISPVAQRAWKQANAPMIDEAVKLAHAVAMTDSVRGKLNPTALAAFAFLVMRDMPDRMHGMTRDPLKLFMDGMRWLDSVPTSDPRSALRRWADKRREPYEKANWWQLAIVIKCFDRFLEGAKMTGTPKWDPTVSEYPELLTEWEPDKKLEFAKRHKLLPQRG